MCTAFYKIARMSIFFSGKYQKKKKTSKTHSIYKFNKLTELSSGLVHVRAR